MTFNEYKNLTEKFDELTETQNKLLESVNRLTSFEVKDDKTNNNEAGNISHSFRHSFSPNKFMFRITSS